MLAFGPLLLIMMLALGFSEFVFNWVVLWRESVQQPRVGAEWVLLGLSVRSLWHLCGVSAPLVEAGRTKGDLIFFCSLPTMHSVALGCGERPEAIATHPSCDLAMTPWLGAGRKKHPNVLGCLDWHLCNPETRRKNKRRLKSDSGHVHCSCRDLLDFLECGLL